MILGLLKIHKSFRRWPTVWSLGVLSFIIYQCLNALLCYELTTVTFNLKQITAHHLTEIAIILLMLIFTWVLLSVGVSEIFGVWYIFSFRSDLWPEKCPTILLQMLTNYYVLFMCFFTEWLFCFVFTEITFGQ